MHHSVNNGSKAETNPKISLDRLDAIVKEKKTTCMSINKWIGKHSCF